MLKVINLPEEVRILIYAISSRLLLMFGSEEWAVTSQTRKKQRAAEKVTKRGEREK